MFKRKSRDFRLGGSKHSINPFARATPTAACPNLREPMIWPFKRKESKPVEPSEQAVRTYAEVVNEIWGKSKEDPLLGGLTLSTMHMADGPIRIHCMLTAKLIQEVERLRAELTG